MIQLSVDAKVRVISACSDGSSPLQFTMTGLSSSTPHVDFAPLRAWREKGGVVRPVSSMYFFVPKNSEGLRRTCHEKDLCLGFSKRRSCKSNSKCKSVSNDAGLLKTLVRRCHLMPSS